MSFEKFDAKKLMIQKVHGLPPLIISEFRH